MCATVLMRFVSDMWHLPA